MKISMVFALGTALLAMTGCANTVSEEKKSAV